MSIVSRPAGQASDLAVALRKNVVARAFVEETVLLDVNCGRYFRLDGTAARLLQALMDHGTVSAAASALAGVGWGLREELVGDLSAFCTELDGLGLVQLRGIA
jgi:hypothetical protein